MAKEGLSASARSHLARLAVRNRPVIPRRAFRRLLEAALHPRTNDPRGSEAGRQRGGNRFSREALDLIHHAAEERLRLYVYAADCVRRGGGRENTTTLSARHCAAVDQMTHNTAGLRPPLFSGLRGGPTPPRPVSRKALRLLALAAGVPRLAAEVYPALRRFLNLWLNNLSRLANEYNPCRHRRIHVDAVREALRHLPPPAWPSAPPRVGP